MEALLSSWGCQCLCVDSSTSALAALAHMPAPDVVITDFRLRHEETGKQVLQALQAQLGRALPAIIMTGDTSPQRLRDAQSADAVLLHEARLYRPATANAAALGPSSRAAHFDTSPLSRLKCSFFRSCSRLSSKG